MKKNLKTQQLTKIQSEQLDRYTYLMLTFPFVCNYRCTKCFNLEQNRPNEINSPIDFIRIKEILYEARDMGIQSVILAGEGEPTLEKEIKKIVEEIHNLGLIPVIYTNGNALTKEFVEFYFENDSSLVIAVDSLIPEIYDYLTCTKNQLPFVLNNIEYARKVFKQGIIYNDDNYIVRLAINTTVSSSNKNEITKIKDFCGNDIYFICNPLARHGNAVVNWNKLIINEDDYFSHLELVKKYSDSGGPLTLNKEGLCGYSFSGIGIGPDGVYMTCAYTVKTNGLLGNIKDTSIKDAFEFKHRIEKEFYQKYGNKPCLIRDENFNEFLNALKSQTIPSINHYSR